MALRSEPSVAPRGARRRRMRLAALLGALGARAALAQSPESDAAAGVAPMPEPDRGYLLPDFRTDWLAKLNVERDRFSMQLGAVLMLDYTWFEQDAASVAQVGVQEDTSDLRELRFTARGKVRAL